MNGSIYWHTDAVIRARQTDLVHRAHEGRHRPGRPAGSTPAARRRRPAPLRAAGHLLIGVGHWLGGAEAGAGRGRLAGTAS